MQQQVQPESLQAIKSLLQDAVSLINSFEQPKSVYGKTLDEVGKQTLTIAGIECYKLGKDAIIQEGDFELIDGRPVKYGSSFFGHPPISVRVDNSYRPVPKSKPQWPETREWEGVQYRRKKKGEPYVEGDLFFYEDSVPAGPLYQMIGRPHDGTGHCYTPIPSPAPFIEADGKRCELVTDGKTDIGDILLKPDGQTEPVNTMGKFVSQCKYPIYRRVAEDWRDKPLDSISIHSENEDERYEVAKVLTRAGFKIADEYKSLVDFSAERGYPAIQIQNGFIDCYTDALKGRVSVPAAEFLAHKQERWKPGNGEAFEFIDCLGTILSTVWIGVATDHALYQSGNCYKPGTITQKDIDNQLKRNNG